jgi:hypothetical protein
LLETRVGMLKNAHCIFKVHAVFPLVGSRFHWVPLEPKHPRHKYNARFVTTGSRRVEEA